MSKRWIGAAFAAVGVWLVTLAANLGALADGDGGLPPQINAYGVALAGSLSVVAAVLFIGELLRKGVQTLRDGQLDIEGAMERHGRAVDELGASYANLATTMPAAVLRTSRIPESRHLN